MTNTSMLSFRYNEVPASGNSADRLELPIIDTQDVWLPRSFANSADEKRMGGSQVSLSSYTTKPPDLYYYRISVSSDSANSISRLSDIYDAMTIYMNAKPSPRPSGLVRTVKK
jgi:hypothetical protein